MVRVILRWSESYCNGQSDGKWALSVPSWAQSEILRTPQNIPAVTVSLPNDSARPCRPTGGLGLVKIMKMTRDDSYAADDDENDQRSGWVCVAYHFPLISGPRRRWLWQLPFSTTISTWWGLGRHQHQYSKPFSPTISTIFNYHLHLMRIGTPLTSKWWHLLLAVPNGYPNPTYYPVRPDSI